MTNDQCSASNGLLCKCVMSFTKIYKTNHCLSAHSLRHILLAGQSNPPNHLSMFLEVTDSKAGSSEWSCFVSHRLSVVNQKFEGDRFVHLVPSCICMPKRSHLVDPRRSYIVACCESCPTSFCCTLPSTFSLWLSYHTAAGLMSAHLVVI